MQINSNTVWTNTETFQNISIVLLQFPETSSKSKNMFYSWQWSIGEIVNIRFIFVWWNTIEENVAPSKFPLVDHANFKAMQISKHYFGNGSFWKQAEFDDHHARAVGTNFGHWQADLKPARAHQSVQFSLQEHIRQFNRVPYWPRGLVNSWRCRSDFRVWVRHIAPHSPSAVSDPGSIYCWIFNKKGI